MTNITVSTQVTHETTTTEMIALSGDVQVHRVTVSRTPEGKDPTSSVFESVVYKGVTDDKNFGTFKVVDPSLLNKLKMSGWFEGEDYDLLVQTPFTKVLSGEPYEVIRIKDYDHSIYNMEGEHLPVAKHFNYLDGGVNDYNFDLERLLAHLQARSDVTLVQERFQGYLTTMQVALLVTAIYLLSGIQMLRCTVSTKGYPPQNALLDLM
jgi:hypothetical protein